jgi:hypothetical protein
MAGWSRAKKVLNAGALDWSILASDEEADASL